jgi:hypothetical protein
MFSFFIIELKQFGTLEAKCSKLKELDQFKQIKQQAKSSKINLFHIQNQKKIENRFPYLSQIPLKI